MRSHLACRLWYSSCSSVPRGVVVDCALSPRTREFERRAFERGRGRLADGGSNEKGWICSSRAGAGLWSVSGTVLYTRVREGCCEDIIGPRCSFGLQWAG